MLWGGERTDVYVGTRIVAVCKPGVPVAVSKVNGDGPAELLRAWAQGQQRAQKVRLWLSGGLCRPFMLPRVERTSAQEMQKIAASLVPAQIGWSEPAAVRVDMPRSAGDAMAVAVKARTVDELTHALGESCRILSIRPWWAEVLRMLLARHPGADCLAVQDCDSVCVIAGEGRAIQSASVTSPIEDRTAAESAIARLRFAQGVTSQPLLARLNTSGGELLEWVE